MWNLVVEQFNNYAGSGFMLIYYFASVIYLFCVEKRKDIRLIFVYMPLILLLIFFNPWIAKLIIKYADDDIYYRMMWIVPVGLTVVYALTKIIAKLQGKIRILGVIVAAALIALGGRLVYTDKDYSIAQNEYHVPQDVVDICDAIVVPGREVMAAFPSELLIYVRQYSAFVRMPYGWDEIKENPDFELSRLRELIDQDESYASELADEANKEECHYIIVKEDKKILGDMSEYHYDKYKVIDGYIVYRNELADYSCPDM